MIIMSKLINSGRHRKVEGNFSSNYGFKDSKENDLLRFVFS